MTKGLVINPGKCTGCTTCSLICSITHSGNFDLGKARIHIGKNDMAGVFNITFSSSCIVCGRCATICPSECLSIVKEVL